MTEWLRLWLARVRLPVVLLFVAAIAGGMLLPVYTDEMGWRFQERAGFDGLDKVYSESCGPNTLARPPAFMMPVRWYSAIFNGAFADPVFVRLSGVLYALAWAGLLLALVARLGATRARRDACTVLAFALLGLGVMPLLLVWSRPEQPILLATTAALLLAMSERGGPRRESCRALAVIALAAIALSYHFKALVLMPAFCACLWFTARGWGARAVGIALLVVLSVVAKHYWFGRLACPLDPILSAEHARQSLGLQLLGGERGIGRVAAAALGNLDLLRYVKLAAPTMEPMSQWLEPHLVGHGARSAWRMPLIVGWGAAFSLALARLFAEIPGIVRKRRVDRSIVLGLLVLGAACLWAASQLLRNVYEASFVLPLLALAILLLLGRAGERGWDKPLGVIALSAAAVLPFSIVGIAFLYGPSLWAASTASGYLDRQPYSTPTFTYRTDRARIVAAAAKCGFSPDRRYTGLVVDERTYFAFQRSRLPEQYLGVLPKRSRGNIGDPVAYLRRIGSDGVILDCHRLPPELGLRAKRRDGICCLSAADLRN